MYIHSPTDSTHIDFPNSPSTEDLHNPENALFLMIVKKRSRLLKCCTAHRYEVVLQYCTSSLKIAPGLHVLLAQLVMFYVN